MREPNEVTFASGAKVPDWILEDNAHRQKLYQRNLNDERFLYHLNQILEPYEQGMPILGAGDHPLVFIIGLPRAGKTLLSQLLSFGLDVGYINNLVAKFWRAPTYGIQLSHILSRRGIAESTFKSDYGKTASVFEPHDFSYFWQHWLAMESISYDPEKADAIIKWPDLKQTLIRITHLFGKACVFKSPNPSYHIIRLSEIYPKILWVYLQRDNIDIALSLMKGRIDNYNDVNHWYGQAPLTYDSLTRLPWAEQIAGQISGLSELYEKQIERIPRDKVFRVHYSYLCANPREILTGIVKRIKGLYEYDIPLGLQLPSSFTASMHNSNAPHYGQLAQALLKAQLPLRLGANVP